MSNITIFIFTKRHWLVIFCREVSCKRSLLVQKHNNSHATKKDPNGSFGGSGGRCSQVRAWLRWRASNDGRQPRQVGCKAKHCCAKHKIPTCNKFLVQRMGFEPTQPCGHWYLKPARMPFRHLCIDFLMWVLNPTGFAVTLLTPLTDYKDGRHPHNLAVTSTWN